VGRVTGRQEEVGAVAAEVCEQVGGGLEEGGRRVRGARYGGEGLAGCPFAPGRGCFRWRVGFRLVSVGFRVVSTAAGLVAGDRAGDDAAVGDAVAFAAEVAVGLQLP